MKDELDGRKFKFENCMKKLFRSNSTCEYNTPSRKKMKLAQIVILKKNYEELITHNKLILQHSEDLKVKVPMFLLKKLLKLH